MDVKLVMDDIERNQQRFRQTKSLRKQYRLCKENERLFAYLGVTFEPMEFSKGLVGWWIKR